MKNTFQGFARYNSSVNQSLLQLLQPLEREQIMMETKAYFPSIFETLFHILITDLNWLKRYKRIFHDNKALEGSQLLVLEEKGLREEFKSDYARIFQYRKQVDELIVQLVDGLEEYQMNPAIRYKNYKGEVIEKALWKTLLHWFNHQTHHRGQISVLLDMVGIDHDFSSLATRI